MIETSTSLQRDQRFAWRVGDRPGMGSAGEAEIPHQLLAGIAAQMLEIFIACRAPIRGGYSRLEGLRPGSTGLRVAGSGALRAGPPPGRAAAMSPYPPQYLVPAEPPSTCTPQKSMGRMTTSRRIIERPLRSSTVRCPSGPIMTKAVDKVRRPWASAGESARGAGAGFSAADSAAVSGTGPGLRIAASLGGGLQATSAAMHGSKRQGITPLVSLNTAFATGTAPSSHWARERLHLAVTEGAEAAVVTKACAGDLISSRRRARYALRARRSARTWL